jgi:multiple sugar transport system substrate-binding protein
MDGYVISSGTAHPNEAWRWIEYLSRQQIDRVMPGSMPARKSVAEASGFWSTMDAERAAAYQWSLEHTPPLSRSEAPDNLTMIADALAQAHVVLHRDPKADLAKALKDAQREVWDRVALSRLTPTAQPDLGPVMVATPPRQEAPEGAVTIRFLAPSNNLASLRRLTYTFSEQHPDIFVELPSTTSLGGSERLSDYARGGDCFWWYEAPRSDADFAALLDLRPLIDADPSFPRDDIPAALYSAYERNGGLYGLPFAFSLRSLGFNRTALDAAGLEPPTADWTPEDFLRAAQALTKGEGDQKQYGYVPVSSSASDLFFFIGQFGGQLSTGSGDTIRPNFTDPTVVRAVQWYIDLSNVHRVAPPLVIRHRANQPYDNRSEALIQTGRAGLWFVPSLLDDADRFMMGGSPSEVGVAPLPVGAGGLRGGDLRVVGYHISAASAAPQQCWAWISFLSGKLNIVPEIIIPARQSLALSEDYTKIAPPPLLDLYRAYGDALKRPSRPSVTSEFYQRFDLYWFFKAISAASEQDKDLDAELTEAQRLTTAYLECMVKERQQKPATCARSADPGYQGFASQDRVP